LGTHGHWAAALSAADLLGPMPMSVARTKTIAFNSGILCNIRAIALNTTENNTSYSVSELNEIADALQWATNVVLDAIGQRFDNADFG
jgi:hypothetical protein